MLKKLGFTLIEMLIVISIISIILSITAVTYTQVSKQSRDARRKTDLEQLRGALEQFRATNNYYIAGNTISALSGNPGLIQPIKYIESIPADPKVGVTPYDYDATPAGCNNAAIPCIGYILTATLETTAGTYQVTPYGVVQGGGGIGGNDDKQ